MSATKTPNSEKKPKNRGVVPKRGQIKAQIFEGFMETVASLFSPKVAGGDRGDESDGNSAADTSAASVSPPPPTA